MGIGSGTIKLLMQEGLRQPFSGRVLTLGKQDIWSTYKDLKNISRKMKYPLNMRSEVELSPKKEMREDKLISDRTLFSSLGFTDCFSIDFSDYEHANFLFDLNSKDLPPQLENAFEVIIDGGTIEHVFHIPRALENIFKMLKVKGRIIHISPSSNHVDHGFYMFSPTLFSDFYEKNKWEINRHVFIQYAPQSILPWRLTNYKPGCLNSFSYGGLDDSMYAIGFIATKNESSTGNQIPQQRNYLLDQWVSKNVSRDFGFKRKIKKSLQRIPFLYALFARIKNRLSRKFHKLPFLEKY